MRTVIKLLLEVLLACSTLILATTGVSAATFSDAFDDGSFTDWTVARNRLYSDPTKPCANGTQPAQWHLDSSRLGIIIKSTPCITEIKPSQFTFDPSLPYKITFDMTMPESVTMDRAFVFQWIDPSNWYDLKILDFDLLIQKVVNGSDQSSTISSNRGTFRFQANQTYSFTIERTSSNQLVVTINGQEVIRATDRQPPTPQPTTLALKGSAGSVAYSVTYFDNITFTNQASGTIQLTNWKQTDTRWANDEYDSASAWSERPTIARWGCALTSTAMILVYHGMVALPDGTPLTPQSLNAWLLAQPDGYVGQSLINWNAITRLTGILERQNGTPALEYSRATTDAFAQAINHIQQQLPVILQIPGHFLVGSGVAANGTDIAITDPAYSHSLLSQHNTELLSARLFTPSHTNLSYLTVTHDPAVTVVVTDADGATVQTETLTEYLTDPTTTTNPDSTQALATTTIAKPSLTQYDIHLTTDSLTQTQAVFYYYDVEANVQQFEFAGWLGQVPLTVHADLTNQSQPFSFLTSWSVLEQAAAWLYQSGIITLPDLWYLLFGTNSTPGIIPEVLSCQANQEAVINWLTATTDPEVLNQNARNYLLELAVANF